MTKTLTYSRIDDLSTIVVKVDSAHDMVGRTDLLLTIVNCKFCRTVKELHFVAWV